TAAWLPWVLWTLERFRHTGSLPWVAWAGTFLALQGLAGQIQLIVMGGMVWVTWLVYYGIAGTGSQVGWSRLLLGGVVACWLGALGCLPQMAPMLEVSRWSGYGRFNPEFYHSGNLKIRFLVGLVGPWMMGGGFGATTEAKYWGLVEHGIF